MELPYISSFVQVALVVTTIVCAAVYIKAQLTRQSMSEITDLAGTRGQTINDLRLEIEELRREVAELRGQYQALQALKINDIANAVVAKLVGDPDISL